MPTTARQPPGPRGRLLSGSLRDFMTHRLDFLTDCVRQYGDVCSFRFGPRRIYLVSHPDLIEQVLVTDARYYIKHFGARMYKPVLGNGLVTSEGNFWLRQRRLAQPAFQRSRLNAYAPVMVDLTKKTLESWNEGNRIDIHAEISGITSAIALKTLFDLDSQAEREAYTEALREVFHLLARRFSSLLPTWMPTLTNLRIWRSIRKLNGLVDGFIRQGRARKEPGNDLLSRLILAQDEDGTQMTDRQLRDEAMTLYLAGHETTALTLSWTWYLLAQNPEIEERLVAEWSSVLGGRAPTVEDLPHMPLTENVILEAMRIYPPVYLIGREPTEDRPLGEYVVPRGTTIFLSQWVMHRDARYFEEPLRFRPDRWANGLAKRLPKYAYFPFGGGPRVCIGNNFALMEAALLLATIGQQFRFTLEPEPKVDFTVGITLMPANGIPATVRRRK